MAFRTVEPTRRIVFDGQELADLDPTLSVADVVRMHTAAKPNLASAVVGEPEISEDGTIVTYDISCSVGTKG
jgi:PRTRC genetic system protein C